MKNGDLWYNGRLLISDKPFQLLQLEKKRLLAQGFNKALFKLKYTQKYVQKNNNG